MTNSVIRANPQRLWETVTASAKIGVGRPNGLKRVALCDDDREMRDLFVQWCKEAGCTVTVDAIGNIFGRREGTEKDAAPILVGSHLDTQINGGRYDGILGVLAALELVRTLNDKKIQTKRPIEIVSWTNEEGARFSPPMIASGVFSGAYELDWALDRVDDDGIKLGDELKRIGYAGDAPVGGRPIDSYLELHIEQGPLLDAEGIDVGVVTHGYSAHGIIVEVTGETAHTGPWPMDKRRNALVGGSMLAVASHEIGWKFHETGGKGTASRLVAWPNRPGILSDWAQFTGDFRHEDPEKADQMLALFKEAMKEAAQKANVKMDILDQWHWDPNIFNDDCIQSVRDAADALSHNTKDIASQAGHDAYFMAAVAPTAMVFTPCRDGITHNNNEHTSLERSIAGVDVLLNAALARANR